MRLIRECLPDVVVCDVMLGAAPIGLDVGARLDAAGLLGTRVLLLSYFAAALPKNLDSIRAAGVLDKAIEPERLGHAVLELGRNGTLSAPARRRAHRSAGPRPPSEREAEIMRRIAEGSSNVEVASALGISDRTVETHLQRLCAALPSRWSHAVGDLRRPSRLDWASIDTLIAGAARAMAGHLGACDRQKLLSPVSLTWRVDRPRP